MSKTKDIRHIKGRIRFKLPDGSIKEFDTSEEALRWFEENYKNHSMLLEDDVSYSKNPVFSTELSNEEKFRRSSKKAMSNPASPYNAAKGWIIANAGLVPLSFGAATAPVVTIFSILGDLVGLKIGNKLSDYVYNNPDKEYKLNVDTSITPREATRHAVGVLGGEIGATFGLSGMKPYSITGSESETEIIPLNLFKVRKKSVISPEEMKLREEAGFTSSKYLGEEDGLNIYELNRLYNILPLRFIYNRIRNNFIKNGWYPFEHKNLMPGEEAFFNPVTKMGFGDVGVLGRGLIGVRFDPKTFKLKYELFDASTPEPIESLVASLDRNGGKLTKIRKFNNE